MMAQVMSYLTAEEVQAAQLLHQRAPYALCHVSDGFFSIARHYGGLTYNNCSYTYVPEHDECVRDDVLRMVTARRKAAAAAARADEAAAPQTELPL
jgi:hypothetical protein